MKKTKLIVLGLITNNKNEVLLSQRFDPDIKGAHLKWDLLGGTNEFGESLETTLKREIKEETGLKVKVMNLLPKSVSKTWKHKKFDLHVVIFCYHCLYLSGKTHLDDPKIHDLQWVSLAEISKFKFLPTTKYFIDMLLNKEVLLPKKIKRK